jgi:hypothetical protein
VGILFSFQGIAGRKKKRSADVIAILRREGSEMSKAQDVKKDSKKKAQKSLKEKRAEKKSKKGKI